MSKTHITKERLHSWQACMSGVRWFLEKFPQSGEFADVYAALIADKRTDDAGWLADRVFAELDTVELVGQTLALCGADETKIKARAKDGDVVVTTDDYANAATTGTSANAATTGYSANAATTGTSANAATTGTSANAATTGYSANAATTGNHAVAAALGYGCRAQAGETGAIVIVNRDDDLSIRHIFASKVGENGIKPGVWYELNADGKPVEVQQ